jgi:hypothetical protein
MPQNRIRQFQPGMSLDEFFSRYSSEAQCEASWKRPAGPPGSSARMAAARRMRSS